MLKEEGEGVDALSPGVESSHFQVLLMSELPQST